MMNTFTFINPDEFTFKYAPLHVLNYRTGRYRPNCWCYNKRINEPEFCVKRLNNYCCAKRNKRACTMQMYAPAYELITRFFLLTDVNKVKWPIHNTCKTAMLLLTNGNQHVSRNRLVFKCGCKTNPIWIGYDDPAIADSWNQHNVNALIQATAHNHKSSITPPITIPAEPTRNKQQPLPKINNYICPDFDSDESDSDIIAKFRAEVAKIAIVPAEQKQPREIKIAKRTRCMSGSADEEPKLKK